MRTDVREAVERSLAVTREQQGLVQASLQECERQDGSWAGDLLRAVDELPASREDLLPDALEYGRIPIEGPRQRAREADVLVDHPCIVSHSVRPVSMVAFPRCALRSNADYGYIGLRFTHLATLLPGRRRG